LAINAAIPTITAKPRIPAAIAIIRKIIAHINIGLTSFFKITCPDRALRRNPEGGEANANLY
jgi:hypothetical protein